MSVVEKFVADESVERGISKALQRSGHEVWEVDTHAAGASDRRVLELTRQREAILLTADKDFGDLVYTELEEVRGVVLLRLQGLPLPAMIQRSVTAIEAHVKELAQNFVVVGLRQVRVRPLPSR